MENSEIYATIYERGNGFPNKGDYVTNCYGDLYRIVREGTGWIQTTGFKGNWLENYILEESSWDDLEEGEQPYYCLVKLDGEEES